MAAVDAGFASWLKAESLTLAAATAQAARWPSQGVTASGLSPFATVGGAAAEGQRRADFVSTPTVRDRVVVDGEARSLIGRCIEVVSDALDYTAGEIVFVLKVEEQPNNTSVLTVLRRLA